MSIPGNTLYESLYPVETLRPTRSPDYWLQPWEYRQQPDPKKRADYYRRFRSTRRKHLAP